MVDHIALLPAYCAAGTALLAFLCDLVLPGRRALVLGLTAAGAVATAVACWRPGSRATFCVGDNLCSYEWGPRAAVVGTLFAATTALVVLLSGPVTRTLPVGEYCFLLACSMTGGVVLAGAGDLVTLVVALETLTLPLYVLVGLRRHLRASAEAAVTFFLVSVVATSVTLLGVALLYAATGVVHLSALVAPAIPLGRVGAVLVLAGLSFKVAAVPFHAWAPSTYDGAPLPVAAYLSTASKVGGIIAILLVASALGPSVGPFFVVVSVLTMTVGNLVALRQDRMVRLLAWSSVAQVGYLLAPLAAPSEASYAAVLAYTVFYVALELTAFGAVIALRPSLDGGSLASYRGVARQRPLVAAAFGVAIAGLAGLPPGLAGLFAKVTVVSSLLSSDLLWLAIVVGVNAVIGLAYYLRAASSLFGSPAALSPARPSVAVSVAVGAAALAAVVLGFVPQLLYDLL
jgi:NADH-quinone oxidoreductase subunit N